MKIKVTGNEVVVECSGKTKAALLKDLVDSQKFFEETVAIEFPKTARKKRTVRKKTEPKVVEGKGEPAITGGGPAIPGTLDSPDKIIRKL